MLGSLMALPLGALRADEGGPQAGNDGDMHHWKHDEGHDHKDLGITDDQKAKLKSIREAQEKALKPIWRKQRDLSMKLRDQLEDKASDSDIQHTLSDLKANRETLETEGKRFMSQREAILTPTQRARMMLARERWGGRRGHWDHEKMDHRDGDYDKDGKDGEHHHPDHEDGNDQ
jgi:Spy/CpxP family protein refolding chaperone